MEASKINDILLKIQKLPYKKILVNGPWGIGKTKHIGDSIKGKKT